MQFYNLKTRAHVDVPETDVKKKEMKRKTKNGELIRYAFVATYNGAPLFKFVKKADYDALKADVVKD